MNNISLTKDELIIINNALNEILNGVHISDQEFHARIGVDKVIAKELLKRISQLIDQEVEEN